jgi:DNA repair exonuclease SbcCD ATPase subunit
MNPKHKLWALLAAGTLALAGCNGELSLKTQSEPNPRNEEIAVYGGGQDSLASSGVSSFDNQKEGGTITDAVSTHEKYIQALEETKHLVEQLARFREKARDQEDLLVRLQSENNQLKQELADATAMLVTMRKEMDKWKADIFHYRKEIKDELAGIRNLQERMIRILGGEVPSSAKAEN